MYPAALVTATTAKYTPTIRTFSNTTAVFKKGGKAAREASRSESCSSSPSSAAAVGSEDPFDFSALESDISDAVEKLKSDLSQLRQGGRFNPQVLESLRVQLKQADPTGQNPLLLNIPIPPPTAESRKQAVAAAAKAGDVANNAVRNARQGQQKKLRAMQLAKSARPDDLKKAGTQMEKVEVKKIVDAAKKALDA
ncbi:unnamed protein product [Aureobasidium mustum]|uniref:Ribosome recycling factor domain-containing protein n=1 Tax=Aureobasidium mustum TaxID=2773714 RepID=A0A9N8P9B5_9PEZI|nr:unnamed protein product [Aureobasidium mustum]